MRRPRGSLWSLGLVAAVVAVDCGLVRLLGETGRAPEGLLAAVLSVSAGLIGVLLARGRLRRFSAGVMASGLVVSAAWHLAVVGLSGDPAPRFEGYVHVHDVRLEVGGFAWTIGEVPGPIPSLLADAWMSLPLVGVSLAGGLLTPGVFGSKQSPRPSNP